MKQVDVQEAEIQFSQLLAEVEAGDRPRRQAGGAAGARRSAADGVRQAGAMKGEFWFAPDYEEADAEILGIFEESINAPLFPDDDEH